MREGLTGYKVPKSVVLKMSYRRPRWVRFCDANCAISTDAGIEP